MNAGDTFVIDEPGTALDTHLWVVISEPFLAPNHVLIVSFTTLRADSDPACVLRKGDHPFIVRDTCISYEHAKVVSEAQIGKLFQTGYLTHRSPVSAAVLDRIRRGVCDSTRMALKHADILEAQGLIDC